MGCLQSVLYSKFNIIIIINKTTQKSLMNVLCTCTCITGLIFIYYILCNCFKCFFNNFFHFVSVFFSHSLKTNRETAILRIIIIPNNNNNNKFVLELCLLILPGPGRIVRSNVRIKK